MNPSSDPLQNEYVHRLNRVIDYIQAHPTEDLNLTKLASIACFSKYHFHRLFHDRIGETLNDFIQRIRLEKAVHHLASSRDKSITTIALENGFSSSQQFSKAFKALYGYTPSHFRKNFNWEDWKNAMKTAGEKELHEYDHNAKFFHSRYVNQQKLSSKDIRGSDKKLQVNIVELQPFRVAYVRSIGPYSKKTVSPAFEKLNRWADPKRLQEAGMIILGVYWSNPFTTPEDKMIFDACITVPESIKADKWVNTQILPGGRYAVYRCEIENTHPEKNNSASAWMSLTLNWMIHSDYVPDKGPMYQFHCHDPEGHPLKHETHDLCMPIKPLYE